MVISRQNGDSSIRRSPRFSSSSSSSPAKSVQKNSPNFSNLPLSLHVIHDYQPIPLKTIYNSNADSNSNSNSNSTHSNSNSTPHISCRRRSPRPSSSNLANAVENNVRDLAQVPVALALTSNTMHLRRSPRFDSNDSPAPLLDSSLSDATTFKSKSLSKKRKADEAGVQMCMHKCGLRKSPRLSANGVALHAPVSEKRSKDVVFGNGDLVVRTEKSLRSRAVECRVERKSSLCELESIEVSEKCLRSREFRSLVSRNEHVENKSALAMIELPVTKRNQTPIKTKSRPILDMSSGKQLRSGNVVSPAVVADNIELSSLIEHIAKDCSHKKANKPTKSKDSAFIGEPIADVEARERWGWRYELKSQRRAGQSWILNADEEDETILNVECHYSQAKVSGCIFNVGDCAFIKGDGKEKHVGRILEFFRTTEGEDYFRVQWFYKAEDTVMKDMASFHDKKRLFYSTLMNDNPLDCLISKVNVLEITRGLGLELNANQSSDFYYDMEYCVEYSTFRDLMADNSVLSRDLSSINYTDTFHTTISTSSSEDLSYCRSQKAELALLDLYSGCGGMSTGLCLGAKLSSVNLVTRWAVDYEKAACDSLKLNHPETQVNNMPAEDFLELLIEWEKLCNLYAFNDFDKAPKSRPDEIEESKIITDGLEDDETPCGEYEVSHIVDISYGSSGGKSGKRGLKFKVRWKGYDPSEDTWEPIESLSNCQDHLRDFVTIGSKSKILPVPGDVDVICGGPPCQGISGYNRFRNVDAPLTDERNRQIVVFMDIVKFLKPKYVLMENVADLLRFDKGSLGRYALSRMVHMRYQARIGIMAAGSYGLPQFRLRVFLWGALSGEKLPQFPLPTHDVVVKFWPPPEFEQCTVAYNEGQARELEEAAVLRDAISDLPAVTSHEIREEMTYEMHPETEFQKYIRLTKHEIMGFSSKDLPERESSILYDHRTYQLNEDDYLRVCQVPRRKGANFRDFPGVVVDKDNRVHRDHSQMSVLLPSGKPLVPEYVFTFEKGKSRRPFARLWWDETVGTVVTFPSCHNMAALHPEQDRVLTLREFARLQGFPDFYRFCGTVKERYCQVGNAVAVPVARALGYALGMAFQKLGGNEPCLKLPPKFSIQVPEKAENFVAED